MRSSNSSTTHRRRQSCLTHSALGSFFVRNPGTVTGLLPANGIVRMVNHVRPAPPTMRFRRDRCRSILLRLGDSLRCQTPRFVYFCDSSCADVRERLPAAEVLHMPSPHRRARVPDFHPLRSIPSSPIRRIVNSTRESRCPFSQRRHERIVPSQRRRAGACPARRAFLFCCPSSRATRSR